MAVFDDHIISTSLRAIMSAVTSVLDALRLSLELTTNEA